MNSIDLIIIVWGIVAAARGYQIGLLRQAASLIGFLLGLWAGARIVPLIAGRQLESAESLLVLLGIIVICAAIGSALFEMLAVRLQRRFTIPLVQLLNASLGLIFGIGSVVIVAWLILPSLNRLPLGPAGLDISESKFNQFAQRVAPVAPDSLRELGRLITPRGFPQIFTGDEPSAEPLGAADPAAVEAAVAKGRASTVRIEGYACGGIVVGSGFVVSPGFVVTNAHVVAGVDEPVVMRDSTRYRAVPIAFDPGRDVAVLRVGGLDGPILPLSAAPIARGTTGAVLGFPGGGGFHISPSMVLAGRRALGRDIYGGQVVMRDVYELQADIQEGNSGGPLVLPDGTVAGIVFGKSLDQENIGYAINAASVRDDINAAITQNSPVGTGTCLGSN